jgi:hypothetical protein
MSNSKRGVVFARFNDGHFLSINEKSPTAHVRLGWVRLIVPNMAGRRCPSHSFTDYLLLAGKAQHNKAAMG